jgi:hypothetical protein
VTSEVAMQDDAVLVLGGGLAISSSVSNSESRRPMTPASLVSSPEVLLPPSTIMIS